MTAERRTLVEGLTPPSPERKRAEKAFVYGDQANVGGDSAPAPVEQQPAEPEKALVQPALLPQMYNRVPITTRARPELASALKRASLQRQLVGTEPFYVQDILEAALESWLRSNGHLV